MNTENQNPPCQCAGVWVNYLDDHPTDINKEYVLRWADTKELFLANLEYNKYNKEYLFIGIEDVNSEMVEWLDETRCACKERQFIKGEISVKPEQMEDFRETVIERQQDWVRVDKTLPTNLDADKDGCVLIGDFIDGSVATLRAMKIEKVAWYPLHYWTKIPAPPQQ